MEIVAKTTFVAQSPRKMRLVADQVRGMPDVEAEALLQNLPHKAARLILPVLKQGIGNAVNNFSLKKETLKIKKIEIGEGSRQRRWRFVGRGRVHPILKRTSHINLVLEGEEAAKRPEKKPTRKRGRKKKE